MKRRDCALLLICSLCLTAFLTEVFPGCDTLWLAPVQATLPVVAGYEPQPNMPAVFEMYQVGTQETYLAFSQLQNFIAFDLDTPAEDVYAFLDYDGRIEKIPMFSTDGMSFSKNYNPARFIGAEFTGIAQRANVVWVRAERYPYGYNRDAPLTDDNFTDAKELRPGREWSHKITE